LKHATSDFIHEKKKEIKKPKNFVSAFAIYICQKANYAHCSPKIECVFLHCLMVFTLFTGIQTIYKKEK
jgi:hypothetical protein